MITKCVCVFVCVLEVLAFRGEPDGCSLIAKLLTLRSVNFGVWLVDLLPAKPILLFSVIAPAASRRMPAKQRTI